MTDDASPTPSGSAILGAVDRSALEEERDFLLASLDDLEQEFEAGDVDPADYRTLKNDYTARAAAVLRTLDGAVNAGASADAGEHAGDDVGRGGGAAPTSTSGVGTSATPARSVWRRRALVTLSLLLVAGVAGTLVMQASGRRGSGGLTGLDVTAASSRFDDCQGLETSGDADAALACYSEILESLPANATVLTYRGWLQVRSFDLDDGLDDLDAAIDLDPDATAPYVFRASGRSRDGDPAGAVADLARFYANDPGAEETALADQFAPTIVDAALDTCIAGDVGGTLAPVAVAACYTDVLGVDADNPTAAIYLGWLLGRAGDVDQALLLLDRGIDAAPDAGLDADLDAGSGAAGPFTAAYVFRAAVRGHAGDVAGAREDLAAFAALDAPADQVAAAAQVTAALDEGRDPLPGAG